MFVLTADLHSVFMCFMISALNVFCIGLKLHILANEPVSVYCNLSLLQCFDIVG